MSRNQNGGEAAGAGQSCSTNRTRPLEKTVRLLLILSGSFSLGLGILGIFLPVLPTTPLLLLASLCYMRSSPKIHSWLINHKVLGEYIYYYTKHRAIRKRTRVVALISLWASLLISSLITDKLPVRLMILVFGMAVSMHLLKLRVVDNEEHLLEAREKDCFPNQ